MIATAERGARFHPTVGSATPTDLPLATPELRPRCCETASLFVSDRERRLLSFFSAITHSVFFQSSPLPLSLASALITHSSCLFLLSTRLRVERPSSRWSGLRTLRMGGSPPSLITHEDPFTDQPGESFNSGPTSRSWFFGPVKSKYSIGFCGS